MNLRCASLRSWTLGSSCNGLRNLLLGIFLQTPSWEAMKTTLSTDVLFGNDTEAWKLVSSCFIVVLLWAPAPEPKTRSNTTNDRDLFIVIFHDIIHSCSSLTGPRIQSTSPNKWQIRSVQQSFGKLGNIEDNDEEGDNTPEEIHEAIYVKTINGKTISIRLLQKDDSSCHIGRS